MIVGRSGPARGDCARETGADTETRRSVGPKESRRVVRATVGLEGLDRAFRCEAISEDEEDPFKTGMQKTFLSAGLEVGGLDGDMVRLDTGEVRLASDLQPWSSDVQLKGTSSILGAGETAARPSRSWPWRRGDVDIRSCSLGKTVGV